jgi:protein gp37
MSADTKIEWASKSWNPMLGCDRVSPACDSCYAIGQARIRESNPHPRVAAAFAGVVHRTDHGLDWTGQVNLLPERLGQPLGWKKPERIFVNSLSDLFHKDVPHDFIVKVFAIMALSPHHTYLILTKRHARMRSVLQDISKRGLMAGIEFRSAMAWAVSKANPDRIPGLPDDAEHRVYFDTPWPLPNVHLGVSVENQQWANARIPALLDTPAAVRWISAEPLLGPIRLSAAWVNMPATARPVELADLLGIGLPNRLDWVVTGGETGAKARPSHPDWFRSLRDQCTASDVAFFFKQWGDWGPEPALDDEGRIVRGRRGQGWALANDGTLYAPGDLSYPDGPRRPEAVRANHGRAHLVGTYRVGKKTAGRELDDREHNALPAVTR